MLAVPILDTGFVIAKRIKYRRPIYRADRWHFHHRMANIGFSQRRTLAYLYGWAVVMAGLALALRFVPYSDDHGNFDPLWTMVMLAFLLLAAAASFYLVFTLEILKLRGSASATCSRPRPRAGREEVDEGVAPSSRRAASRRSTPRPGSGPMDPESGEYGSHKLVTSRALARSVRIYSSAAAFPGTDRAEGGRLFYPWDRTLIGTRDPLPGRYFEDSDGRDPSTEGGCRVAGRPRSLRRSTSGGRVRARIAGRPCGPARIDRVVRGARRGTCPCLRSL